MSWPELIDLVIDGPVSWLWPIVLLPILSTRISDRAARWLPPTRADWRVAAVLAGGPGLILLLLLAMAVGRGLLHFHWDGIDHFVEYHLIWSLAPAILFPAVVKARRRSRELRLLTSISVSPDARLRHVADAVGIEARELRVPAAECFVAGAWRPIAYVSTSAVARMSDEELYAALCHERAHRDGLDPAFYVILAFLVDLVQTSDDAMRAFRQARERRADAEAVARAGALNLASALLALARPRPHSSPVVSMAGADAAWRLQAILAIEPESTAATAPARIVTAMVANAAIATWPAAQASLAFALCT